MYLCPLCVSAFFPAVSPSDNSRTFGLSPVWPLETPSHKQANGDLRLGPHWRPQSPKSPKSPKVLRLSPQESRCVGTHLKSVVARDSLRLNLITECVFLGPLSSLSMRAKLLESDINENGESKDDFEEYRPSSPTPPAQNGSTRPPPLLQAPQLPLVSFRIFTSMNVNYE